MVKLYKCEYCGEIYELKEEALKCEEICKEKKYFNQFIKNFDWLIEEVDYFVEKYKILLTLIIDELRKIDMEITDRDE